MSHVLKTYPDGSEITTTNLAAATAIAGIAAMILTAPIWIEEFRDARKCRKNRKAKKLIK